MRRIWEVVRGIRPAAVWVAFGLCIFAVLGARFTVLDWPSASFSDELLIRDLIDLDVWVLSFFIVLLMSWALIRSRYRRSLVWLGCLSAFGFVAGVIVFHGTPFSYNAYWGDQAFRQAMILKLQTFGWGVDFFYRDLPSFYPPLYFYVLSLLGKLLNVELIKLLKTGSLLIFLFGPTVLYYLWRRIVRPAVAVVIVVFAFLVSVKTITLPFTSPHAFIGNAAFIPWWLAYVEGLGGSRPMWKHLTAAGLLGGCLFMVYPYPFFIGGLILILRSGPLRGWSAVSFAGGEARAWLSTAAAAVVSAPYWLPALVSVLRFGGKPADQEWFHAGHTGVHLGFNDFSVTGIVYLLAIILLLRYARRPVARGLLILIGGAVTFYFVGAFLGSIDSPVNLQKASDFLMYLAAPAIGWVVALMLRLLSGKSRLALLIAVLAFLLSQASGLHSFAQNDLVIRARKERPRDWGQDPAKIAELTGKVGLSGVEKVFTTYPLYAFIANNQHYSHPASRFEDRYNLLALAQPIADPARMHLVLRENIFGPVEWLIAGVQDGLYEIPVALSNYPDRSYVKRIGLKSEAFEDSLLFGRGGNNLILVSADGRALDRIEGDTEHGAQEVDPISVQQHRWLIISEYLSARARSEVVHAGLVPVGAETVLGPSQATPIGRQVQLQSVYTVNKGDSAVALFCFKVRKDIASTYKVFVHYYPEGGAGRVEYDFLPERSTSTWKKGDLILCRTIVPAALDAGKLHVGLFRGEHRLGSGAWLDL